MKCIDLLKTDKNLKIYRPELKKLTGSIEAAVLLQQILFRLEYTDEFYKFKLPCSHPLYVEGDSWCEELEFTEREFEGALKKLKAKGFIKTRITIDRVTYYSINEATLEKELNALYEKDKLSSTKRINRPLDNIRNTSKNNSKNKTSELIHSEDKSSSFINSSPLAKNENPNLQKCEKSQISVHLPDFINPSLWDDWTRHRREIGHSLKPTTIQKQLKQLAEWQSQGYDVNKIIEQSIVNGWQGLFLPKKTKIEQNPLPAEIEQAVREGKISEEGAYSYASALNWLKRYEGEEA
jgi:DNA-binding PadR family transcriptional regulator